MATNLPIESNRIATSEAPRTSLSGQDIASPYGLLADNFARGAELTNDWAKDQAAKAGQEAVSEDGKTIDKPALPIIGDAAQSFHRAALTTSLNRITPDIQNKMTEIRLAHQNDPTGFQTAAKSFTKEYLDKNVTDPMLRGAVEKTALDTAGSNYRHVLQSTDSQNVQSLLQTSQARLTEINDRSASLARQGLVDTPEYAELQQSRGVLYRTLASDPRTGFTMERADIQSREDRDRDVVQQSIGQAVNGATSEADVRKTLEEKFWGPGSERLNLSPQKRDAAITQGVAAFNNRNAEDSAETAALRSTVTEYASGMQKAPNSYDEVTHNQLVAQAAARGDRKSVAALDAVKTMAPLWQSIASLPIAQRAEALRSMSRGIVPQNAASDAMTFFQEKGYSKEQSAGIVGNLIQESGLDPNTVHDNGTGLGIAGHRLERREALKAFAAERGKPATDFRTQLEFIDHELKTSEGKTGTALRGAKTAEEAATAFINFERPLGWTAATPQAGHGYANRVAQAARLAGGDTTLKPGASVIGGNPYVQKLFFSTATSLREQQGVEAQKQADDLVDRAGKGQKPAPGQVQDMVTAATSAGRPDIVEKARPALVAFDAAQSVMDGDSAQASAVAASARAAAAGGAGMTERKVYENIAKYIDDSQKRFTQDPLGEGSRAGWIKPPGVLPTGDPGMAAAEFASRNAKVAVLQQQNASVGPVKVISDAEAPGVATALTQGDPAASAGLLGAMATSLSPDNFQATIAQKDIAGAVTGMMSSRDPVRMNAAMATADKLWRSNPAQAKEALGDAAITKLQAWQGLKDTFNAAELAERLNAADDPSMATARKQMKESAETETSKLTPADMAYKLGSSWGIPVVSSMANVVTGATPAAPFDAIKGGALLADYRSAYTALRTYGVDPDKASDLAVKRLQSSWGVSGAGGNQVMQNPPERYYPSINGSQDWIKGDLQKWIVGHRGAELQPGGRSLEIGIGGAGQNRNWSFAGLIADSQTQADISAKRPPSYQVAIRKPDGTLDLIEKRIAFDPSEHLAANEQRLRGRQEDADWQNRGQFFSGMPLP